MPDNFSYDADKNQFLATRQFEDGREHKITINWNPDTTPNIGWDDLVAATKKTFDSHSTKQAGLLHNLAKKFTFAGVNLYYGEIKNANYDEASVSFGKWGYKWPVASGEFLFKKVFKGQIEPLTGSSLFFGAGGTKNARYISLSKVKPHTSVK